MDNNKLKNILLFALIFVSVIAISMLAKQNIAISELAEHEKSPDIGSDAYLFNGKDIDGKNVDARGANTVIIFFSSSCESCTQSFSRYNQFYEKNRSENLQIIAVSPENPFVLQKFAIDYEVTMPIMTDSDRKIIWEYRVRYVPLIVLINKAGEYVYYGKDGQPTDEIFTEIENHIGKTI